MLIPYLIYEASKRDSDRSSDRDKAELTPMQKRILTNRQHQITNEGVSRETKQPETFDREL